MGEAKNSFICLIKIKPSPLVKNKEENKKYD